MLLILNLTACLVSNNISVLSRVPEDRKTEFRNQENGEGRTAASTNHHRHERKAIADRPPGFEGVRSVGAVLDDRSLTANVARREARPTAPFMRAGNRHPAAASLAL